MRNYIDTRDLYKRKCELEELKEAVETAEEELKEAQEALEEIKAEAAEDEDQNEKLEAIAEAEEAIEAAEQALDDANAEFGEVELAELAELEELESEISDFMHGETMIPVDQFEDYAREFADDIGAISRDHSWPLTCIDWEQAARELAMDYAEVTYQGESYYVHA